MEYGETEKGYGWRGTDDVLVFGGVAYGVDLSVRNMSTW